MIWGIAHFVYQAAIQPLWDQVLKQAEVFRMFAAAIQPSR